MRSLFYLMVFNGGLVFSQQPADTTLLPSVCYYDEPVNDHLREELRPVRDYVYYLTCQELMPVISATAQIDSLNATIYYLYNSWDLQWIIMQWGSYPADQMTEFFFRENDMILCRERSLVPEEGISDIRSYFRNGKLLHQAINFDCGAPFADDHLVTEQERIQQLYLSLISIQPEPNE